MINSAPQSASEEYGSRPITTDNGISAAPTPAGTDPDHNSSEIIADHVLGDQPAGSAQDDKLGFAPYVAAVAKFLTDSSTKIPLTLSIEGLWGSGKSSFMLQLQEALVTLGKTKIVSFNAWQYNADDSLWAVFINEFDAKLNEKLKWREKVRARFRLLALRISWQDSIDTIKTLLWLLATLFVAVALFRYLLNGGIPVLEGLVRDSGNPGESANKIIALVGGTGGTVAVLILFLYQLKGLFKSPASLDKAVHLFTKPNYSARLPLIHQVTRDFQSLVSAHAGKDDVYVFVDDLDRCEYSKAAELMQALLMLLGSAPKIALIIGLDRDKVAAAMAARQEKLLPYLYKVQPAEAYTFGIEYGQRFIEKFIQLSYILPTPRSNGLKAMINPAVERPENPIPESQKSPRVIEIVTGKNDSETLNIMIDMADEVFAHNPRNIKQFVNMFRLQAFIANETGLFGSLRVTRDTGRPLTIPQLGKFVALCTRWPEFVEAASADPNLVSEMEEWLKSRPKGEKTLSGLRSQLAVWGRDKNLIHLLNFRMPSEEFSLAGVDFEILTGISPARAKNTYERRDSVSSEDEPNYQTVPTESFDRARPKSSEAR